MLTLDSVFGLLGGAAPLAVGILAERAGPGAALCLLLLAPAALLVLVPTRHA